MSPPTPWVITGAAGFLGSYIVPRLLERGTPVVAIDDFSCGREEYLEPYALNPNFTLTRLDIRDTAGLSALFELHRPAAVVHLAALHFIPACMADPPRTVSVNVHGTQSVLSAARAAGVERFWFTSTGDIYVPDEKPHHETRSKVGPFNIYGLSKLLGEQLTALESRERPNAAFVVGRLFNLYGPRETNPHFLPELLKQLRAAPEAVLRLGNLWPKRDMVPVADAASAVIDALEAAPPGMTTLNVATGVAVTMQQILDLIGELRGSPLPIETDPSKVRSVERPHLQADVGELKRLIGWTPHIDLRRGIAELLAAEMAPF
ncbi:MAG: NAD(P)-dependent oxidoreductase [Planctomycetales bacterium]|nr:NAD(P)-dependent oxidoreductase [Planctomycetales bacterium]MBN8627625.1 NAD(P)-dependent oxidoreductase [Planctomycetota bacterium]